MENPVIALEINNVSDIDRSVLDDFFMKFSQEMMSKIRWRMLGGLALIATSGAGFLFGNGVVGIGLAGIAGAAGLYSSYDAMRINSGMMPLSSDAVHEFLGEHREFDGRAIINLLNNNKELGNECYLRSLKHSVATYGKDLSEAKGELAGEHSIAELYDTDGVAIVDVEEKSTTTVRNRGITQLQATNVRSEGEVR